MKKLVKKLFTAVLAVAMMMGMMAIPAFAEDEENLEPYSEVTITVKWDKAEAEAYEGKVSFWCGSESNTYYSDYLTKNEDGTWTITIPITEPDEDGVVIGMGYKRQVNIDDMIYYDSVLTKYYYIPSTGTFTVTVDDEIDTELMEYGAKVERFSDGTYIPVETPEGNKVTVTVKWDKAEAENKTVYAWCWSTFENYTESRRWPGDAMTKNGDGTWTITIQTMYNEKKLGFIPSFKTLRVNEDGTTDDWELQTIDLEIPGSGNVLITVSEELDPEDDKYLATVEVPVWKYEKIDEQSVKIQGYLGDEKEIVVPAEIDGYAVKSIDGFAFNNNKNIEKVTLPEGITTIYDGAFYGCENLKSINIPDGVTLISIDAFKGCKGLKEIKLPDSVITIGKGAFDGCESLESIVIPEGVKGFGDWTFYGCSSLKSIIIPKSVTGIGREVFEGCTSMVIYCYSGSYAVTYAKENNIAYKLIDAPKPGWKRNANGWWYDNGDETYPNSTWKKIDGNWYYFNSSGYMVTGWLKDGNNWYYLESNGKMAVNKWVDRVYYVKSDGAMAVSEWVDGGRYYVDSTGKWFPDKTKGTWKKDTKGWWFDNENGTYPKSTWKRIDGSWYYFDNSGYMVTGWLNDGGKWYYLESNGKMAANKWVEGKYYMKSNGVMATDEWVDEGRYYVDAYGRWVA